MEITTAIYQSLCNKEFKKIELLDGIAGVLLFIFEYEKKNYQTTRFNNTIILLEKLLFQASNKPINPFLSSGLSGVNIVLKKIIFEEAFDNYNQNVLADISNSIDTFCIEFLNKKTSTLYSDFLHGDLGILWGVHCFSSKKINLEKELITLINATNIYEKGYFYTKSNKREMISLGISHGLPALLVIISQLMRKTEKKEEISKKIVEFMLSKRHESENSLYPSAIVNNEIINPNSRLAWCYGDLGIGIAFWQAGKALNREEWKQEAIEIFLHSSKRRDLKKNGVVDAGLCHGTSGIAHIFNRMYWETKNPIFKETANYWVKETIKMASYKDDLIHFKSWHGSEKGWEIEYGFLEGIAGIGLALLSHDSSEEPIWDKCLLLS